MADFKAIETFLWGREPGSFRGGRPEAQHHAAAISQRIAQLEREVGVNCCNATGAWCCRPERPADDGLCREADRDRSEMLAAVGDRSAMRGVLRLGRRRNHCAHLAVAADQSVIRSIPTCRWRSKSDITSNLRTRLLAQEIDLAFVVGRSRFQRPQPDCSGDYPVDFLASPRRARQEKT